MGTLGSGKMSWRPAFAAGLVALITLAGALAADIKTGLVEDKARPEVAPTPTPAVVKISSTREVAAPKLVPTEPESETMVKDAMVKDEAMPKDEMKPKDEAVSKEAPKAKFSSKGKGGKKAREREAEAENGPAVRMPTRPERVVVRPKLDAAGVDGLVEAHLAESKVQPAAVTGDEEFIRRVYLDVAGVLPSPQDVQAFRRDPSKEKRARVIDRLLESPEFARNWARYWRDAIKFRATEERANLIHYDKFEEWLADQFSKNLPWDMIATDMITATGRADENGAVVLATAHMGQPVELAGEVSRIFLGLQIQCAQCHDHPTDPWKREQFHQFAAFFAGTKSRAVALNKDEDKPAKKGKGEEKAKAKKKIQGPRVLEVIMQGVPRYTMPDKADPQNQIPVDPKYFLAASEEPVPPRLTAKQRHELIASYITGQDNPWFAKAFVNRVWGALMGEGFVNPIDDLGPTRTPSAPEVLDALASQWQRGGYDVRWLYRTILNTKAYQREFRPSTTAAGKTPFAANVPSRLRSDQIFDTLEFVLDTQLVGKAPEKGKGQAKYAPRGPRGNFNALFGVDPSTPPDDVLGTIPQALFLMNAPQVNNAMAARPNTVLGQILLAHPDNKSALDALYLRVLARRPSPAELRVLDHHLLAVRGDRAVCFEDILWCLVNSTEFLSRR